MLTQGSDVVGQWDRIYRYQISTVREGTLKVLLNLALCDKTIRPVVDHSGICAGLSHAMSDQASLHAGGNVFLPYREYARR